MFNGDIAKFNPADLLMFLGHLDKEGVLTVTNGDQGLHISFARGSIVDAHCEPVDGRTLRALLLHHVIDRKQFEYINGVRKETGLPLRQVLENIESFPMSRVGEHLESGIKEVLFHLFLWESGQFHFAEIPVDRDVYQCALSCERLTLDVVWQVDEYREILRSIDSIDRVPMTTSAGVDAVDPPAPERFILEHATGDESVRRMMATAPFPTLDFVKALKNTLDQGWIELIQNGAHPATGRRDEVFSSFKRSLRKIIVVKEPGQKTTEIVNFCKEQFDYSLVVASKHGKVVRCMKYARTGNGKPERSDISGAGIHAALDPIFALVHRTKNPFIGKVFESEFLAGIGQPVRDPEAECAVIPLGTIDGIDFHIYVASRRANGMPGPFHYLEVMSWSINPPTTNPSADPAASAVETPRFDQSPRDVNGNVVPPDGMVRLVESVKELPPLPAIVARTLNVLSDSNRAVSELVDVLSHDPVMVARLIKVSNSALYGRGEKISTLSQTVARLGTRTVRSVVLAASTRSLFPMDQTTIGIWGQSLWQHSVECGIAAGKVAEITGYVDPEEAFVAGILHDIGKVVLLLNLPEEVRTVRKAQAALKQSSVAAEIAVLGFDHTMVGELLLEQWNMPQSLRACVRHHHNPREAGECETLAYIVACGNALSHAHGAHADQLLAEQAIDMAEVQQKLYLSDERLKTLTERISEDLQHSDFLD